MKFRAGVFFFGFFAIAAVAAQKTPIAEINPNSLFHRLGDMPGIEALVSDALDRVAADTRINTQVDAKVVFDQIQKEEDRKKTKKKISEHVCHLTGGPCDKPKGKLLKKMPKTLRFSTFQWLYFIQDINASLSARKVGYQEQGEIIALIWEARKSIDKNQ